MEPYKQTLLHQTRAERDSVATIRVCDVGWDHRGLRLGSQMVRELAPYGPQCVGLRSFSYFGHIGLQPCQLHLPTELGYGRIGFGHPIVGSRANDFQP